MDEEERKLELFNRRWQGLVARAKNLGKEVPNGLKDELWIKFRDTNFCEYCGCEFNYWAKKGEPSERYSPSIDHMVAYHNAGDNSVDNLCIICNGCNLIKGTMPMELYLEIVNTLLRNGRSDLLDDWKKHIVGPLANKLERVAQENAKMKK